MEYHGWPAMRVILTSLILVSASLPAFGDEWASRHGNCFEMQGYWTVDREQSGGFSGYVDFQVIGGPCLAANDSRMSANTRAVIAGTDFFAVTIANGSTACLWHGSVRGDQARGFVLCPGAPQGMSFVLSLKQAN